MRIGIDTGGTFTDVAVVRTGQIDVFKVPSTPADPAAAVLSGLAVALSHGVGGGEPDVIHGTTVGLNAILTGQGLARVALVTNTGMRDLIEIGRQQRTHLYQFEPEKRVPPVPRELRFEIDSRRAAGGALLRQPGREELRGLARRLRAAGCQSLVIGLLHSPGHDDEQRIAAALRRLLPHLPITCSAELLPRHGEFERFSTAILNAAIQPLVGGYLRHLEALPGRLRLLASSGGILSPALAQRFPAKAMFSGPAGGVVATRALARHFGYGRAAAIDIGGTSADLCLVEPEMSAARGEIAGLPLALPTEDIHTIGCGGGSIAWLDAGGALRVGPHSAGADPGPACYGSGTEPTVTDAHVALGHLGSDTLLGGGFPIDPDRSVAAITRLARGCGLTPRRTAAGILEVAETNMLRALLRITAERGIDPRGLPLIAYGGAGGLHGASLCRRLGMSVCILPQHPGAFSAVGLALAGEAEEVLVPIRQPLASLSASELRELVATATAEARERLQRGCPVTEPAARLNARGRVSGARLATRVATLCALRFVGQGECLQIPFGPRLRQRFLDRHQAMFGFCADGEVELVEVQARAYLPPRQLPFARSVTTPTCGPGRARGSTQESMRRPPLRGAAWLCLSRNQLPPGSQIRGPALIEELTATTLVPGGATAVIQPAGIRISG